MLVEMLVTERAAQPVSSEGSERLCLHPTDDDR
jgi:hypothetical protein